MKALPTSSRQLIMRRLGLAEWQLRGDAETIVSEPVDAVVANPSNGARGDKQTLPGLTICWLVVAANAGVADQVLAADIQRVLRWAGVDCQRFSGAPADIPINEKSRPHVIVLNAPVGEITKDAAGQWLVPTAVVLSRDAAAKKQLWKILQRCISSDGHRS